MIIFCKKHGITSFYTV